jgi:TatD DNase family protein
LIDSHCHLADEAFAADLDAVVDRAKAAGLERALIVLEAGNAQEAAQAARAAALWPDVRVTVGVHPHQAHQFAADPGRAAAIVRDQIAATPSARAIGEIGLDYHYDFSPRDVQHAVFRAQLRLARELRQPVVIHTRDAGIITFPRAEELRQTVRRVPMERLLTETDSPFLAPVPHRGTRNEPAHVARVVATLAEMHGMPADDLAARTAANFHTLFRP